MEGGAMIEAGAVFAALLAALRVIEKLVDKKMGNGTRPVQVDLHQTEIANQVGQMTECLAATGQTLERINDKIDNMDLRQAAMSSLVSTVEGRVKDVQDTGHKTFNIVEAGRQKAEKAELLREIAASQTGGQAPVT
jgi:predicted nucleic acid-binding OB-fold protein